MEERCSRFRTETRIDIYGSKRSGVGFLLAPDLAFGFVLDLNHFGSAPQFLRWRKRPVVLGSIHRQRNGIRPMSQALDEKLTADEFLRWAENREGRFEFVDGRILRMQARTVSQHHRVVVNVIAALKNLLRGKPCRPFTADFAVRTAVNRIRRPDAGVDCGKQSPQDLVAREPVLVVEVFSPGTRDLDRSVKIREYQAVETLKTIVYVEPNRPEIYVFERGGDGEWNETVVRGLNEAVPVPALDLTLPLAEIFEDVDFSPSPFLI